MLEKTVKEKIKRLLKRSNAWYTMPYQSGFSQTGVPDFLVCHRGQFIAVEAKAGDNKPTKLQLAQMEAIELAAGKVIVINEDSLDELKELLL